MTEKELPDHERYKIIPVSFDNVDERERMEMIKIIKELGYKILLTPTGTKVNTEDTIVIVPPLE